MWPGVYTLDKSVKEFKQGQICVIYAQQSSGLVPIATGRMTNNWQAAEGEDREVPRKGKAVTIEHNLFDELWNMGNRNLPQEVQLKLEEEGEEVAGNQDGNENRCSKGHGMKLMFVCPEEYGGQASCDKCLKNIEYEEGFFHCNICGEDYHKECHEENKKEREKTEAE